MSLTREEKRGLKMLACREAQTCLLEQLPDLDLTAHHLTDAEESYVREFMRARVASMLERWWISYS